MNFDDALKECRAALRHSIDAAARGAGFDLASTPRDSALVEHWFIMLTSDDPQAVSAASDWIMFALWWTPPGAALIDAESMQRTPPPRAFWRTATGRLIAENVTRAGLTLTASEAVKQVAAARGIKETTAWAIVNRAITSGAVRYVVREDNRAVKHVYRADVDTLTHKY